MNTPLPLKIIESAPVEDLYRRPLRELRMSVIDRCNFRCSYCMPADSLQGRGVFLPLEKLLTDQAGSAGPGGTAGSRARLERHRPDHQWRAVAAPG
jgi:hypothetical protein